VNNRWCISRCRSLSTHRHITYTSLYRSLLDYSCVEQRLGK